MTLTANNASCIHAGIIKYSPYQLPDSVLGTKFL